MSISSYEYLSIVLAQIGTEQKEGGKARDYMSVLEHVRSAIALNHSQELGAALNDESAVQSLKVLILKYTTEYLSGLDYDRDALVERIFQDMTGMGVLSRYLRDPTVEEININAFNFIELLRSNGTEYLCGEDAFPSPEAALDIIRRMVRLGGKILDAQTPRVDSAIGSNTRISASIPPVVSQECGVTASIRKQNKSSTSRERLIEAGTASPEMLDFMTMCLCSHVSIGIAGSTGSGKSFLQNFCVDQYITRNEDYNNRVLTIEDTQELHPLRYDEQNDRPARVIAMYTSEAPARVTMFDLTKDALRYHPQLIVPAEVRDGAVYEAMSAGRTGHTILTSFHADGAKDSYSRLLTLCHMAEVQQTDEVLLNECIKAWPIIVYAKQLKDNTRKIMEIFEATGIQDGQVVGTMLYRFHVGETIRDGRGHITKVCGSHERVGCISPRLYSFMRDNGASEQELRALFPEAKPEAAYA